MRRRAERGRIQGRELEGGAEDAFGDPVPRHHESRARPLIGDRWQRRERRLELRIGRERGKERSVGGAEEPERRRLPDERGLPLDERHVDAAGQRGGDRRLRHRREPLDPLTQRPGVDGEDARPLLVCEEPLEVAGRGELLPGPGDLRHTQPWAAQEGHQASGRGRGPEPGEQAADRGEPLAQPSTQRHTGALRLAAARLRAVASRRRSSGRGGGASRLGTALRLELHRSRSSASSMTRAMRSANGSPASSACFGYMLVAVKPGSVFISLMYASSAVTRKSTRARPAQSTAR